VPGLCERVRALLEDSGSDCVVCELGPLVVDDLATVNALARLQLVAGRLGCRVLLRDASVELRQLLAFLGLDDVVVCAGLRGEAAREAEEGEQPVRVQERVHRGDPAA
jgi:hypothetical protein